MKKIISLAMCLILLLSLCACGKSKQAKAVEEQISTIGDVSLEKEATILSTLENYNQLSDAEKETVENYSINDGIAQRKIVSEISRSTQDKFIICQTLNIGFNGLPGERCSLHPHYLFLPFARQTVKLYVVHVVIEKISQFSEISLGRIRQFKDTEHSERVVYVLNGKFEICAPPFVGIFHIPSCQTVFNGTGIVRVENRTKFLIRILSTFKHRLSPFHFGSDI